MLIRDLIQVGPDLERGRTPKPGRYYREPMNERSERSDEIKRKAKNAEQSTD